MGKQANKWQSLTMLKQRIITALILASVVLWALFGLSDTYLLVLFATILLAGAWEWGKLAEIIKPVYKAGFLILQAGMMWFASRLFEFDSNIVILILASVVMVWFLILFWLALYERGTLQIKLSVLSRTFLGLILLPATFLSVAFILQVVDNDRFLVLLMFLLIWGADVAAYFSGRAFGKNKLAPKISPAKTWEGVVGALLMTVVISITAGWLLNYPASLLPKLIIVSLFVVSISIVGDLFESIMKRQVGIKDSGNILPGHGGVLDRIDSMIAASPVYALGIHLAGLS